MANHPSRISRIAVHHPSRTWIDPHDWNDAEHLAVLLPATARVHHAPEGYAADDGHGVLGRALSGMRARRAMMETPIAATLVYDNVPLRRLLGGVDSPCVALRMVVRRYGEDWSEHIECGIPDGRSELVPTFGLTFGLRSDGAVMPLLPGEGGALRAIGVFGEAADLAAALQGSRSYNHSQYREQFDLPQSLDFGRVAAYMLDLGRKALVAAAWRLDIEAMGCVRHVLVHRDDYVLPA
jgi:hypothetical protein